MLIQLQPSWLISGIFIRLSEVGTNSERAVNHEFYILVGKRKSCQVSDFFEFKHINRELTDIKGGKLLICVMEPFSSQILYRHYFLSNEQQVFFDAFLEGEVQTSRSKCHRKSAAWLETEDRFPELSWSRCDSYYRTPSSIWIFPTESNRRSYSSSTPLSREKSDLLRENACKMRGLLHGGKINFPQNTLIPLITFSQGRCWFPSCNRKL